MLSKENGRKVHIDLLRILACFSVILLHSASQYWYDIPITSPRWLVCNSYDAVSRFGVPIFVMISGMLFLSREGEINLKRLYRNNILRLAVAYWVWSALYGLWDSRVWLGAEGVNWKDYAAEIIYSRYHLWFIPMMIGIYMLLPVIKTFTDHAGKKCLEYFLVLFLVMQIGVNTILIINPPQLVQTVLQLVDVEMACSYVAYFILGYYLYRYPVSEKKEKYIYLLGILGAVLAVVVSAWASWRNNGPSAAAFDSYSVFTFAVSVALFVFFQKKVSGLQWGTAGNKVIEEFSANTFGVYLLHLWVMEYLQGKGIDSMCIDSVIGIPLLAVVCFLVCNVAIAILRRIPLIGKYIC
ncbi:MAG: acyltransferase family protein [Lachnospiraceae bacterium]|nr:acyltransferase family protein [Lachnospiraceae bacterium]